MKPLPWRMATIGHDPQARGGDVKGIGTKLSLLFLGATVVVILTALMLQASSGPHFRAADHDSMAECVNSIPSEWRPGSLEYDGAETACYYVHVRGR